MPSRNPDGLQKHTLHLFEGDYEKLGQMYPDVPKAEIVRKLVRTHIEKTNEPFKHELVQTDVII